MCTNVGLESDMCDPQECRDVYMQQEFDDLTGEMLDPDLVKEGCREDMDMFKNEGL